MSDQERFERAKFIAKLVDEFKLFCMDSIMDGMGDDLEDHFDFLDSALETFIDIKADLDEN